MLNALVSAVWRAASLVVLGLAPYSAPLDATRAHGAWSIVRVLLALLVAVCTALACVRFHRRDTWPSMTGGALGVLAALLSATFVGDRGPLARGVVPVSIAAWLFVAALLTDAVARALHKENERAKVRAALGAAALVIAGVSLGAAWGRFSPRARLWEGVLARDPGNESAAVILATRARDAGDAAGALATLKTCALANPEACRCAEEGGAAAIDLGVYGDARAVLSSTASCAATPLRMGVLAEALAGTNELDAADAQARAALSQHGDNAHALFARAWVADLRGDHAAARAPAERAVALGRGGPAEMLLGTLLVGQGDLDGAKRAFDAVVKRSPNDARAIYDVAYIAHQQGRYHEAREGYLRALKLEPSMLEARYNLAILSHAHGADAEAQHHFEELVRAAPGDARVGALRAALAAPR